MLFSAKKAPKFEIFLNFFFNAPKAKYGFVVLSPGGAGPGSAGGGGRFGVKCGIFRLRMD